MTSSSKETKWKVICESVRGAMHKKKGLPNQDAFASKISERGKHVMIAVADGHGDSKCFRSQVGSRIAVKIAIDLLEEVSKCSSKSSNLSILKGNLESSFSIKLHSLWKKEVEKSFLTAGFSRLNVTRPEISFDLRSEKPPCISEDSYLAYGTTLVSALVTRNLLMFAQIGDGDVLVISSNGEIYSPVPDDERLLGNATTSLCSPEASKDFRFFIERLSGKPPLLIMLSTDGLSNSFASEEEFKEIAKTLLDILNTQGMEYLKSNIGCFMNDLSSDRVGDDITIGIIFNEEVLHRKSGH